MKGVRFNMSGKMAKAVASLSLCLVLLLSACDSVDELLSGILPDPGPDYNAADEMRRGQENFANMFGQGAGQSTDDSVPPNNADANDSDFVGFDGLDTIYLGEQILIENTDIGNFRWLTDNIKAMNWATDEISEARARNLIFSTSFDFDYKRNTTRAEFCQSAIKFLEVYLDKGIDDILGNRALPKFQDVNERVLDVAAVKAIEAAAALGIAKGYEDNTFEPNGDVNRAEAAAFLSRTLKIAEPNINASSHTQAPLRDVWEGKVPNWAVESVNAMYARGIMKGLPELIFDPLGMYTRDQTIVTFNRLYNHLSEAMPGVPSFDLKWNSNDKHSNSENIYFDYINCKNVNRVAYFIIDSDWRVLDRKDWVSSALDGGNASLANFQSGKYTLIALAHNTYDDNDAGTILTTKSKTFEVEAGFIWPVPSIGRTNDVFGDRNGSHLGIDICLTGNDSLGAEIVASAGGTVSFAGWQDDVSDMRNHIIGGTTYSRQGVGYGYYVVINHGNGYSTVYGHMLSSSVSKGKEVSQRDPIGQVGNTGRSTHAHLHFEILQGGKQEDPMPHIRSTRP